MRHFSFLIIFLLIFVVFNIGFSYSIPLDKLKHISVSFSISLFLSPYVEYPENVIITLGVGVGKEMYDFFFKEGHVDVGDVIADLYGALFYLRINNVCVDKLVCLGVLWVF